MSIQENEHLEGRIREVEVDYASLHSTVNSISQDFVEVKQLLQKIVADGFKVTEINTRLDSMDKLWNKYDELYRRFVVLEHGHEQCQKNKIMELSQLTDISNKIIRIEGSLEELTKSKGKMEGFGVEIGKTLFIVLLLYMLYMIAIHIQPQESNNPIIDTPTMQREGQKQKRSSILDSILSPIAFADYSGDQHVRKNKSIIIK
jgi:hypothetical protein